MKTFSEARLVLTAFNFETEKEEVVTLRNLKANPAALEIASVKTALNTIVDNPITLTESVETYIFS